MEKDKNVFEIPYGTRDFLPCEAAEKRAIETKLSELFMEWGCEEVVTPTIEYLDNLTCGSSRSLEPHLFKFFDINNRTLALRHEMTTPIARLVSSRLQDYPLPMKLSYISSVFRYEQTQAGRQCEFHQAGVEIMGSTGAFADAEIIALAVRALLRSGLKNFKLCIGQIEFINGIMEQYQLSDYTVEKLKISMEQRNLVELGELVDNLELSAKAKKVLKKLPLLNGGEEMLKTAYELALNEQSRRALDNLSEIYRFLKAYNMEEYARFDLGIIRDFSYYTGMVFEGYVPGMGYPLCGGGRYDHLLSDFGNACPATGFALGIERILLALERQGGYKPRRVRDVYLSYSAGMEVKAVEQAERLRHDGKAVEIALNAQSREAAERSLQDKGYDELVYLS